MYNKISADTIFTVSGKPLNHHYIIVDEKGKILGIEDKNDADEAEIRHFNGAIVPGFVNTHCHLELSHMKGQIPTGTGLLTFIGNVVRNRAAEEEEIQAKIFEADAAMYAEGIVAVGDISNKTDTFSCKLKSKIRYYTFVECFDFWQEDKTDAIFEGYKNVFDALPEAQHLKKSLSPHANYSMTPRLFALINEINQGTSATISIHNQETPPENQLFETGGGPFIDFYHSFNIPTDGLPTTGMSSIHFVLPLLDPAHRTLFVHNTLSTKADISAAQKILPSTYWATCANANLYIENRLPDYREFLETGAKVTIGTDSLTSNWQLSVLEEIKTILKYQSYLDFETVLKWATLNGAEALGWENDLGSIEIGKTPGLVNIANFVPGKPLLSEAKAVRII